MKPKQNIVYISILVLVLAAIVFAATKFDKPESDKTTVGAEVGGGRTRGPGDGFSRGNFKPVHGVVLSVDNKASQTIVMKADDGSSKNIICSSSTRISKQDNGQPVSLTLADIKVNDEINVMSDNTTGSDITPRMIIVGAFTLPQNNNSQPPTGGSSI